MSAFSRMPEQWIRDKWYKHAIDTIGGVTPNYNYSARTPNGEGVFLRGKWGGDYSQEFDDSFRSHNHKQQAHTHPITMNVEDGRANGGFNPQGYADFFTRRGFGNQSLTDAGSPMGGGASLIGTAEYEQHLVAAGGISGLQSIQSIGSQISQVNFYVDHLRTSIEYLGGEAKCTFSDMYGEQTGTHSLESGYARVPTGEINPVESHFSWGTRGKNATQTHIMDGQRTVTVEGKYKGTMDDPTVIGEVLLSGGDTSYTNQNIHDKGMGTERETTGEKETAPVNAEVMYIIKIHP